MIIVTPSTIVILRMNFVIWMIKESLLLIFGFNQLISISVPPWRMYFPTLVFEVQILSPPTTVSFAIAGSKACSTRSVLLPAWLIFPANKLNNPMVKYIHFLRIMVLHLSK